MMARGKHSVAEGELHRITPRRHRHNVALVIRPATSTLIGLEESKSESRPAVWRSFTWSREGTRIGRRDLELLLLNPSSWRSCLMQQPRTSDLINDPAFRCFPRLSLRQDV